MRQWLHSLTPVKSQRQKLPIRLGAALAVALICLALWPARSHGAARAQTGTIVSQNIIANTTWTKAGSPYRLNDTAFAVENGATLTIEPGVEVIAAANGHVLVRGRLVAQGTAAEPILFTSDAKTPGAWWGITIGHTEQQPASALMEHVIVEYGNVIDLPHYGNITVSRGILTLRNSIIRNGGGTGIAAAMDAPIQITDTAFIGNGLSAVRFSDPATADPVLSNLTATGNGRNAVTYYAVQLENAHIWERMGLPYVVEGGLTIAASGSLTLTPGLEVQMGSGFYVHGSLFAVGATAAPITLTGITKTPGAWWGIEVSGDLDRLARAAFDHTIIEYGGTAGSESGNLTVSAADVTVTNSIIRHGGSHGIVDRGGAPGAGHTLTVADTAIRDNAGAALWADGAADPVLRNVTATGNGRDAIVQNGLMIGDRLWENIGLPYIVEQTLSIFDGALSIEPGVEVRLAQEANIFVFSGSLFAIGTLTQPVRFSGILAQPGAWGGIYNGSESGFLVLRHCDIGYGGAHSLPMLSLHKSTAFVTNCRIHHSAGAGIAVNTGFSQPVIARNRIEANAFGLQNNSSGVIDARNNWWGDASGPTHTSNPGGKGDAVSDNVLFSPWLQNPEEASAAGGLVVQLSGPGRFAPGDTEQYQVFYANLTTQPIENAVLRVALPTQADYLDSTGGGILWPQRGQLFWRLGTLPPDTQGYVAVRVRFHWGLPDGLRATVVAQLSGSNLAPAAFDVAPYLNYAPRTITAQSDLTAEQVQAERIAYPELDQLYTQAHTEGYVFGGAVQRTDSTGAAVTQITLLRFQPQFSAFLLWRQETNIMAAEIDGSSFTVRRNGLSLRYDHQTGTWGEVIVNSATVAAGISYEECMRQCIAEKAPGEILEQLVKAVSVTKKAIGCVKAAAGDEEAVLECSKVLEKAIPGYGIGVELGLCNDDCKKCTGDCNDKNCHCCKEDKKFCDNNDFLYGKFGISVKKIQRCSKETGRYLAAEVYEVCPLCHKCVDGSSGPTCVAQRANLMQASADAATARLTLVAGDTDLQCDECRQAKDPNELFGPEGDLLPGQLVTYTITYENVGAGEAFDVFIMDELGAHFDASTLKIYGDGAYSPGARSIFWTVGALAPKGQPGSTGVVSFTVRLKSGLPSGTVISNQAVVHFPSVPEETPTNSVVNVVQPLAAIPQQLQTMGGQPVNVLLQGRDVSNTPLTFTVADGPLYGALAGTPPALTYTPFGDFTGLDRILFTVSNGVATSRPAEVTIHVQPSANDTKPPTVLWTAPSDDEHIVLGPLSPLPSPDGPLYAPMLQVQFSEPVEAATVTADTVQVKAANGRALPVLVRYDGTLDQAAILFREPLQAPASYTVTVTQGIKDLNGNAMTAYQWRFRTKTAEQPIYLPAIVR